MTPSPLKCRICGSTKLSRIKESSIETHLAPDNFKISNNDYGQTGALDRCEDCGFIQCSELTELVKYYEQMEDTGYIDSAEERSLQEKALLSELTAHVDGGTLLDVGAGAGILLKEAANKGFTPTGVEPSAWLCAQAEARSISEYAKLCQGVLPHEDIDGTFDAITIIDVIEHVTDPVELLKNCSEHLKPGGYGIVTTPDVSSLASRLMEFKWWHYRTAHVNYFNKQTLSKTLFRAGLKPVRFGRPMWYFSGQYLADRINTYLPKPMKIGHSEFLDRVTIPLNLFDSIYAIFTK